jgi:hypothetical protein
VRELRNAACELADRGWHVLPLHPHAKAPLGRLVKNGKDDATSDLATVLKWWLKVPQANIGVVGRPSGLLILDVDDRNDGFDTLAELEGELGALPRTVSAISGGGGAHMYFTHPGGTLKGTLGHGIDIQDHRYVVAPPSRHPDGGAYVWDNDVSDTAVVALPDPWLEALKYGASKPMVARSPGQLDPLRLIPAAEYVARLTGREIQRGDVFQCPFHAGGQEWDPSLKVESDLWACHGCPPILGKRALGGTIYDLAGLLAGYPVPLRGGDYLDIKERLKKIWP